MAKSQMTLQERKERLLMKSDELRYQLDIDSTNLAGAAQVFENGFQVARGSASLLAATFPRKRRRKGPVGWLLSFAVKSILLRR